MHVGLLLPTLEAVLVAFQRHPHALTQLVDDDVETAYGVFGCASCLCVSALERSDELGLDRGTRVGLVEMLRVLVSPASDVSSRSARTISAEWAEGAARNDFARRPCRSCQLWIWDARPSAANGPARAEQIGAQHVHAAHAR